MPSARTLAALSTALVVPAACGESPAEVPAELASIEITTADITLESIAATATAQAVARDTRGQTMTGVAVSWASRNSEVATAAGGGVVTAVGNGLTWVVASSGSYSDSVQVLVEQVTVAVEVTPAQDSIWTLGEERAFAAEAVDANGFETPDFIFDWQVTDSSVVTIDADGVVTAHQDGVATVSATVVGITGEATLVVDERGAVAIEVAHVGGGVDPDGYDLTLGGYSASVASEGETLVADIPAGSHALTLGGVAAHCIRRDDAPSVDVTKGDTTQLVFEVRCSGRYAFESWSQSVYRMAYADAAGETVILSSEDIERGHFAWSPDGEWLAFSKTVGGNTDVYLIRPDGTDEHRLTTHPGADVSPTWSHDGARLAYRSQANTAEAIWVVDRDGVNGAEVWTLPTSVLLAGPVWSPTEDLIAFVSPEPTSQAQLWTMQSDGSNALPIGPLSWTLTPVWSPDGSRIAAAVANSGPWDLYVMDKDGANALPIATSGQSALAPSWSPTGDRIAYTKHDGTRYGVYSANPDGTDEIFLTSEQGHGSGPAWATDGSHILFTGIPTNLSAVMAVDADGGLLIAVSPPAGGDPLPRPGG